MNKGTLKKLSLVLISLLVVLSLSTLSSGVAPSNSIYNHYRGQLNCHTIYSDGTGTPTEAFDYARNVGKADFLAVTDHSNLLDSDLDYTKSTKWADTKAQADAANVDGQFVAMAAFEMTWNSSTGGWGYINTFNTDWFESRNNPKMNLSSYYYRIAADKNSISQWSQPSAIFGDFAGFGYYRAATDAVLNLIEVASGTGAVTSSSYYPGYDYYWKALDQGWHVAPTIGQDNHSANWITANDTRTVILAPALTRADLYDAMRNRRVYATEDKNLKLMFTGNGSVMGSILNKPATVDLVVDVQDPDEGDNISKIEVITEGGAVVALQVFESNIANFKVQLSGDKKYYYIKVTEADGTHAFSAPIWTGI